MGSKYTKKKHIKNDNTDIENMDNENIGLSAYANDCLLSGLTRHVSPPQAGASVNYGCSLADYSIFSEFVSHRYIVLIIFFLWTGIMYAQLQTAHWYFGFGAGLDFTSGTPVADTNGELYTFEGCTSISDEHGNLLFYSDGSNVYDRNHNIMPNGTGLMGHSSSSQSGIVLPKPDNCDQYYLFTIDASLNQGNQNGLRYSVVDMTLNEGNGDVVTSQKNISMPLNGNAAAGWEKLTAVVNADRTGYWVLTHYQGLNMGNFFAFSVTEEGVSTNPVITPTVISSGLSVGYLKASPDGSRLALARYMAPGGGLSVYDFDTATGIVSNEIIIYSEQSEGTRAYYGVEFSPNGQLLYANYGHFVNGHTPRLVQYDLSASSIIDSEHVLYTGSGSWESALQLGLDDNIYYSRGGSSNYIHRITNANTVYNPMTGDGPFYEQNAVYLGGRSSMMGLPQFLNSYFRVAALFINGVTNQGAYCEEVELNFEFCSQGGIILSILWDFGDGTTSTELSPTKTYTEPGDYEVTLTLVVEGEEPISRTIEFTILPLPDIEIENQSPMSICTGTSVVLSAVTNGETVYWYDSEEGTVPVFIGNDYEVAPAGTTTYWVESVSAEGCISERIPVEVIINEPVVPQFEQVEAVCYGEELELPAESLEGITGTWLPEINNTETTTYTFTPDEGECALPGAEMTIMVNPMPILTIENEMPVVICEGNTAELFVSTDAQVINWYLNEYDTEPFHEGTTFETGELSENTSFWVEAVSEEGCQSDRIEIPITVTDETLPEFEQIASICAGAALEALPTISLNGITGTWSPALDNTETTEYIFTPDEGQCASPAQMTIEVNPIPELQIENQTPEICAGETIVLSVSSTGNTVYWYDEEDAETHFYTGETYSVSGLTDTTTFWVEAVGGNCRSEREFITVTVNPLPELIVNNPNPQICYGSSTVLTITTQAEIVYWYDEEGAEIYIAEGTTFQTSVLLETTTYWVEAFHTSETGLECSSERLPITIEVIPIPTLTVTDPEPACEGSSVTLEASGNGDMVYWYDEEEDNEPVGTGNTFQTPDLIENTVYWVESVNILAENESCASERLAVTVTVVPIPELETIAPDAICAGETTTLSVVTNGQTINWYETDTSEIILYSGNDYETDGLIQTITFWVEAVTGDCSTTREPVTVTVNPLPDVNSEDTILWCDSLNDGVEYVDLWQNNIIISNNPEVSLTFYMDEDEQFPIDDPAHFLIDSSSGVVYVSAAAGDCKVVVPLTIILTEAPAVSDTSLQICSPDGSGTYELTDANGQIINNPQDYTITYHLSYEEAKEDINPQPETYTTLTNQTIFARVENLNDPGCFDIAEIELTYNDTFGTVTPLEECDEDSDGDAIFNLTEKEPEIESLFGGSGYTIIYYETEADASNNVYEIPNPESYENITNPQTVYTKVYDGDICLGIVSFDLIAIQPPEVEVENDITLCPGDKHPAQAPPGYESYTWTDPNGIVISTTNSAILDTEGIYILEITFSDNICTFREDIEVVFDNAPVVTNIEVNGTTVIITAIGTAPLEYSMDGGQTWQISNIFYDVIYGEYEVIVRNANGCESGIYPVVVFEIMNVITPNNDGYNDTWEIPALVNYPGATVKIFDRYGKILVDTNLENGFIWDGKHNGNPLPSTSYWYILDLNSGQKMIGNITLKNY